MNDIPPFKLIPQPTNSAARLLPGFEAADGSVGTRHKLGGKPDWIQPDDWPVCSECEKKMTFYGQLDSINDELIIADCGMLFVFYCFECIEAEVVVQSY